jgi:hypothetical protein
VLHSFWLDVERAPDASVNWTLYFDPIAASERRARNAIDAIDDPGEVEWMTFGSGTDAR